MASNYDHTLWLWIEGASPRRIDYLLLMKGVVSSPDDLFRGKTNDPRLKIIRMSVDMQAMGWIFEPANDKLPAGYTTPSLRVTDPKTGVSRWIRESSSIADYFEERYADRGTPLKPTDPLDIAVMDDLIGMANLLNVDAGYYLRHACPPAAKWSGLKEEHRNHASALNGKENMTKNLKKFQTWAQDTLKSTGWLTPGIDGPGLVDLNLAAGRRYMELGYDWDIFEGDELRELAEWYERFKKLPWWNTFEKRENIHPKELMFGKYREV
jgi:glutathione S-transferase